MSRDRDLEQYRRILEAAVAGTGRDDIGVGKVTDARAGVLAVEFSRGTRAYTAEIPEEALRDAESARRVVTIEIRNLSKEVAQEHLQKAT
jgi:hypothetical protein